MSKSVLIQRINAVNKRYQAGLNDDDQVSRMVQEARKTKGWHFSPRWDEYVLVTDEERLAEIAVKYGYWSDEVKSFNDTLMKKGGDNGFAYMTDLNLKVKEALKQEGTFQKYN